MATSRAHFAQALTVLEQANEKKARIQEIAKLVSKTESARNINLSTQPFNYITTSDNSVSYKFEGEKCLKEYPSGSAFIASQASFMVSFAVAIVEAVRVWREEEDNLRSEIFTLLNVKVKEVETPEGDPNGY